MWCQYPPQGAFSREIDCANRSTSLIVVILRHRTNRKPPLVSRLLSANCETASAQRRCVPPKSQTPHPATSAAATLRVVQFSHLRCSLMSSVKAFPHVPSTPPMLVQVPLKLSRRLQFPAVLAARSSPTEVPSATPDTPCTLVGCVCADLRRKGDSAWGAADSCLSSQQSFEGSCRSIHLTEAPLSSADPGSITDI